MNYEGRNHNQLAPRVYHDLAQQGIAMSSRNGAVLRLPGVTTLWVSRPWECVNFSPVRDCNPFFHLMEALAMLGSFNSVRFLSYFAKNMASFSDDGERFNAFYGERLRSTWGDQLTKIVEELRANPESRQCVAQIWDVRDLWAHTKDKACNTQLMFSINHLGQLEMTSINRSNDAVWGILSGANVVHLAFFQELVALGVGRPMGPWTHVSNNLHVYMQSCAGAEMWQQLSVLEDHYDMYDYMSWEHIPLFKEPRHLHLFYAALDIFLRQAELAIQKQVPLIFDETTAKYLFENFPFLAQTAIPVFNCWHLRKLGRIEESGIAAQLIASGDWATACVGWLERRAAAKAQKGEPKL